MGDYAELMRALASHGVTPRAPSGAAAITAAERRLGARFDAVFSSLYAVMNGFEHYDQSCWLTLWDIELIADTAPVTADDGALWLAIGDFLMDSDLVVLRLGGDPAPVMLFYERRILGGDLEDFLNRLVRGTFDFC